jgi:hypothetical protein
LFTSDRLIVGAKCHGSTVVGTKAKSGRLIYGQSGPIAEIGSMTDYQSTSASRATAAAIGNDSRASGVAWGAIIAGAVAAGALSLILILLGLGFGFLLVSPWAGEGASAEGIGIGTILWLTLVQLASSGLGGYLAGRLRHRWSAVDPDEVYFRDTAHGFLAWGVATLFTAAFLGSVIAGAVGAMADDDMAGTAATVGEADDGAGLVSYHADMLFRPTRPGQAPVDAEVRREAERILRVSLNREVLGAGDRAHLALRVSGVTGLGQEEAEQRVAEVFEQLTGADGEMRQVLDDAREAAAYAMLWMFIALLIGAFIASYAATWGGRHRDRFPEV